MNFCVIRVQIIFANQYQALASTDNTISLEGYIFKHMFLINPHKAVESYLAHQCVVDSTPKYVWAGTRYWFSLDPNLVEANYGVLHLYMWVF